jgi:hypothetical protein
MSIDWGRQIELTRPDMLGDPPSTLAQAKSRLKQYLAQREIRRTNLKDVLMDNGVTFGTTPDEIVSMTELFLKAVAEDKSIDSFSNQFVDFLWNFGQFIGDLAIDMAQTGVNRWKVENNAIRGCPPRYVFVVYGYALESQSFNPDKYLTVAAFAKKAGKEVRSDFVIGKLNYISAIAAKRTSSPVQS